MYAVRAAFEQLETVLVLEALDGLRNGGLHEVEAPCRAGHPAELQHGDECTQVAKLHGQTVSVRRGRGHAGSEILSFGRGSIPSLQSTRGAR